MNIKSLLIGSASAAVLSTSALAADAIVYADPEPMEYVRICDVYGAGFFYIPGTETCMKMGGYFRLEMRSGTATASFTNFNGYTTFARFAPNFDVRSQTEWGTLRGFAELEFDWSSWTGVTGTNLALAFIDIGDRNFVRVGKQWAPHVVWAGPGGNVTDGYYGRPNRPFGVTYYFNSGFEPGGQPVIPSQPGFSGFIGVYDAQFADGRQTWSTDVEAGVGYGWQGGFFRVTAALDSRVDDSFAAITGSAWQAKATLQHRFNPMFTARLSALYNSRPDLLLSEQVYGLGIGNTFGSQWSIIGGVDVAFSPKAALNLTAQWFNQTAWNAGSNSARWFVAAGVDLRPVSGLRIRPEVNYINRQNNTSGWGGVIRMERTF